MIPEMNPYYVINQIDIVIKRNKLLFPMASYDETEKLNNNIEALEVAKLAVEKQIAKEPIATSDDVYEFGNCPHCNKEFNTELVFEYEITHCPWCGQALDWGKLK